EEAVEVYKHKVTEELIESLFSVQEELEQLHEEATAEAVAFFQKAVKVGDKKFCKMFLDELKNKLATEFQLLNSKNKRKKQKYAHSAMQESLKTYETLMANVRDVTKDDFDDMEKKARKEAEEKFRQLT